LHFFYEYLKKILRGVDSDYKNLYNEKKVLTTNEYLKKFILPEEFIIIFEIFVDTMLFLFLLAFVDRFPSICLCLFMHTIVVMHTLLCFQKFIHTLAVLFVYTVKRS